MSFARSAAILGSLVLAASPALAVLCGNGVIEANEACDDGAYNGAQDSCCALTCVYAGKKPDLIVGAISSIVRFGTLNGITAYAVGTTSCNVGLCWLNWYGGSADHPVIAQNMFRLEGGRFEQIGQSWVKHGFAASIESVCGTCEPPPDFSRLGVNCADTYDGGLNGEQGLLGPRSAVNPTTGVFPYPDPAIQTTGNVLFKRLQVHNADLDPALHPTAMFFAEGQYVSRDDALFSKNGNNASYRGVAFGPAPDYLPSFVDDTVKQLPAVHAWQATDPAVRETSMATPADGRYLLASRSSPLGGGLWHYEYALQNLTSHRGAQSFAVAIPPGTVVSNVGFHDVDYHSGEPFEGTDWTPTVSADALTWTTLPYDVNPNANALRWGTLYNFRFDADVPPGIASASISLFRPGSPATVTGQTIAPVNCVAAPAEVGNLRVTWRGITTLTWNQAAGAVWYTVLRGGLSQLPVGPGEGDETCLTSFEMATTATEHVDPAENEGVWYLVEARNTCGGSGYGAGRASATCP